MSGLREQVRKVAYGAAAQLLRLVPGSTALRWKRDLRDAAWLTSADVVLVSYPKSGRTFVRAMLARLYQLKFGIDERTLLEFPVVERGPPDAPRILFTHAGDTLRSPVEIDVDAAAYSGRKIILLARHPGDVAVSRYHHLKHRSRDRTRKRLAGLPLDQFVWSEKGGIPSIVKFLNVWASLGPQVTVVRYDDFLSEPELTLRELSDAVGLSATDEQIADAAKFGSFENLKHLEQEGYFHSSRLQAAKRGDAESSKVRKGGAGGYREELGDEQAARVDAYLAKHLNPIFGYSDSGS